MGIDRLTANFKKAKVDDAFRIQVHRVVVGEVVNPDLMLFASLHFSQQGSRGCRNVKIYSKTRRYRFLCWLRPHPAPPIIQLFDFLPGLWVGSSSAVNCVAAVRAAKLLGKGHTIVTVLCDSGNRHVTKFWNDEFLKGQNLSPKTDGQSLDFLWKDENNGQRE
jgi:hypothetical protein